MARARSIRAALAVGALALAALAIGLVGVARAGDGGTVGGAVTVLKRGAFSESPKGDNSNIAVVIEGVPGKHGRATHPPRSMRQEELRFEPGILVVQKGAAIDFPNKDRVDHNVFSLSNTKYFDLELYKAGTSKTVTFDRAGVVDVFCNIHPQMAARVIVADGPYYAMTDKAGKFEIKDVPPGTWDIVAWPARGEPWRGRVTVKPGHNAMDIKVIEDGKPPEHSRKDGTPYGRYQ